MSHNKRFKKVNTQSLLRLSQIIKIQICAQLWHCRMQNYTAKLYVLHTSLKLNLPHRLCLWTFLILSNVLPIPESPKNIVNMNYITFNEPIGLFADDFISGGSRVEFLQGLLARSAKQPLHLCNGWGCLRGDVPPSEAEDFLKLQIQMMPFDGAFLTEINNLKLL